jgi:hypothetical protein
VSLFILRITRNTQTQNAALLNVTAGGTYSYRGALVGYYNVLKASNNDFFVLIDVLPELVLLNVTYLLLALLCGL